MGTVGGRWRIQDWRRTSVLDGYAKHGFPHRPVGPRSAVTMALVFECFKWLKLALYFNGRLEVAGRGYMPEWGSVMAVFAYLSRALHFSPVQANPRMLAEMRGLDWVLRGRALKIMLASRGGK